ncbi:MAG: LamG-like jellyroll fold domain-containing protein [Gammaproteobacteria bacterium]|nr:LamG-like jellyroll fold domain-containing protein [Gammaproteobacteria bacterium]
MVSEFPGSQGSSDSHIIFSARGDYDVLIHMGDSAPVDELSFRANFGTSGWTTILLSGVVSLNTWYQLAITYNPSSGYIMYLDGNQVDTSAMTENIDAASFSNFIAAMGNSEAREILEW